MIVAVFHAWFDVMTNLPLGRSTLPTAIGVAITMVGLLILQVLLRAEVQRPTDELASAA